jgi:hypothetical protein
MCYLIRLKYGPIIWSGAVEMRINRAMMSGIEEGHGWLWLSRPRQRPVLRDLSMVDARRSGMT